MSLIQIIKKFFRSAPSSIHVHLGNVDKSNVSIGSDVVQNLNAETSQPISPSKNIDLSRLPPVPDNKIIGRETELQAIFDAINSKKQAIAVIAFGGVGKTTLVRQWLENFKKQDYGDFNKIFAWSFYSQGSHETQNSSAQFFTEALPFFGAEEIPKLDEQKGQLLADLLFQDKNMLVLDGLEPLQHRIEQNNNFSGMFKDVALQRFLMAVKGTGYTTDSVVLMTSRQEIQELKGFADFASLDLRLLSKESGAKLLRSLEVQGSEQELQQASEENNGHALALVLLGKWLDDIRERDQLPPLSEDGNPNECHAQQMLAHYDNIWEADSVERQFLYLLGLFDRPMGLSEQQVLFEQAEVAQPLAQLSSKEFKHLIKRLTQANLLFSSAIDFDCHPIIRQYFGQRFKDTQPQAFRQAHLVLFDYYQAKPDKHQPDTLEELEPLYRAVGHGCLAGEYQKALDDIYRERILRKEERHYSYNILGSYSQDLAAISTFFSKTWSTPISQDISKTDLAWLLAQASLYLMALGRLEEAVEPRKLNLELREKQKDWKNASIASRVLTDLYLSRESLSKSLKISKKAIDYSERSKYLFNKVRSYAILGNIFYKQRLIDEALIAFKTAEKAQLEQKNKIKKLHALAGYNYCTLLLDLASDEPGIRQVLDRGEHSLEVGIESKFLINSALPNLTIAHCYQALNQPQAAQNYFNQAIRGVREAARVDHLVYFLIDRANFYLQQQQYADAKRDLDEAEMIIQRGDMKLYAVDWHISMNNYQLAMNKGEEAAEHKRIARELIGVTGYKLRLRAFEQD